MKTIMSVTLHMQEVNSEEMEAKANSHAEMQFLGMIPKVFIQSSNLYTENVKLPTKQVAAYLINSAKNLFLYQLVARF